MPTTPSQTLSIVWLEIGRKIIYVEKHLRLWTDFTFMKTCAVSTVVLARFVWIGKEYFVVSLWTVGQLLPGEDHWKGGSGFCFETQQQLQNCRITLHFTATPYGVIMAWLKMLCISMPFHSSDFITFYFSTHSLSYQACFTKLLNCISLRKRWVKEDDLFIHRRNGLEFQLITFHGRILEENIKENMQ